MPRNQQTDFIKRIRYMGYVWLFTNRAKFKSFIYQNQKTHPPGYEGGSLDDFAECLGEDKIMDITDMPQEDFQEIYRKIKDGKDYSENNGHGRWL